MPAQIQWDDEAKIRILYSIEGGFSLTDGMFDALHEIGALANEVSRPIGVILNWSNFQASVSDILAVKPNTEDTTSTRLKVFRGDFGSSGGVIHELGGKLRTWDRPQPDKITITVIVLPDTIDSNTKNALSQMLTVLKNQSQFAFATTLEEARKIIQNHFQQGN